MTRLKKSRGFLAIVPYTDLPQTNNKFTTHISGFFNGANFRCAHMGYIEFPKCQIDSSRDFVYFSISNR